MLATIANDRLKAVIVDVRPENEYNLFHIAGAINVPHTRVPLMLQTLEPDTPLLVHCNSGARSASAVSLLARAGFAPVQVNDLFANYRQAGTANATRLLHSPPTGCSA